MTEIALPNIADHEALAQAARRPISTEPLPEHARGLDALSRRVLEAVDHGRAQRRAIDQDEDLSPAGKAKKLAAVRADVRARLDAVRGSLEAIGASGAAIAQKIDQRVSGAPADAFETLSYVDIRSTLRGMTAEQRSETVLAAIDRRDMMTLRALSTLPEWDRSIVAAPFTRDRIKRVLAEEMAGNDLKAVEAGAAATRAVAERLGLAVEALAKDGLA